MTGHGPMDILTINSGSSSIKFSRYRMGSNEARVLSGSLEGIGLSTGLFRIRDAAGKTMTEKTLNLRDHGEALREAIDWLVGNEAGQKLSAIGHRIVHGGSAYVRPHRVDAALLEALDALVPLAPDHLPQEIAAIRTFGRSYPELDQVACFDTAFHRNMPDVAQRYALPGEVRRLGVVRYGFHGLSYEYILKELGNISGAEAADGRVIIAHLGNGASMGAFRNGKSADTTMGFTPAGGLAMSTRSGDLDPGVIVYLLKEKGMDASALNRMVNRESGLYGVSAMSADMAELLKAEPSNRGAAEAVELFCYTAKKFLGALAAVLGGLDTLVFTGGIGENAPSIRERICNDLGFLGIRLDTERNSEQAPVISRADGLVTVRVMKTNEELMIARHTAHCIAIEGRHA
ncbi:MAG TPA: acetate/propionate family kinase [Nitrospirota bacterium]|nr:acetate/propionate family kinase [Nitrospirota bacterium]